MTAVIRDSALLAAAAKVAVSGKQVGPSKVQRRARVGFATAMRLVTEMRELGIVGPQKQSGYSDVLADRDAVNKIFAAAGIEARI